MQHRGNCRRRRIASILLLVIALVPSAASAHGDPGQQIGDITRQIELHPQDAALYLRRSDLHRSRSEWTESLADLQTAGRLDPGLAAVDLLTARTLLEAGSSQTALAAIDRFVARAANHPGGHLTRARILMNIGSRDQAAAEFTRGIELTRESGHTATPDDYLDRARLVASQGNIDAAVAGLDAASTELGGAITLKLLAIDLEIARENWDAALDRLSAIERNTRRKETWIARRADVLWSAGRRSEAESTYRSALAAIDALPERTRNTIATRELAAKIRTRVVTTDSGTAATATPPLPNAHVAAASAGPAHGDLQ